MYKIVLMLLLLTAGCSSKLATTSDSYSVPPCVTKSMKGFVLEGGYDYEASNTITGYQMTENGYIQLYYQERWQSEKRYESVCRVPAEQLCKAIEMYHSAISKIPVVNEPGKRLSFINFKKPEVNFYSSVTGNEYNTFASTDYRALFDTLMSFVKPALIN